MVVTKDEKGKVRREKGRAAPVGEPDGHGCYGRQLLGHANWASVPEPAARAAVGAGAGTLSGTLSDIGINDQFMKDLAANSQPGCAAVFVLVRKATTDKVVEELKVFHGKGTALKTSQQGRGGRAKGSDRGRQPVSAQGNAVFLAFPARGRTQRHF